MEGSEAHLGTIGHPSKRTARAGRNHSRFKRRCICLCVRAPRRYGAGAQSACRQRRCRAWSGLRRRGALLSMIRDRCLTASRRDGPRVCGGEICDWICRRCRTRGCNLARLRALRGRVLARNRRRRQSRRRRRGGRCGRRRGAGMRAIEVHCSACCSHSCHEGANHNQNPIPLRLCSLRGDWRPGDTQTGAEHFAGRCRGRARAKRAECASGTGRGGFRGRD